MTPGSNQMSEYAVVTVGAEDVWPPAKFNDLESAFRHAIRIAKTFKGVTGSPRFQVIGPGSDPGVWSVDGLLFMEDVIDQFAPVTGG